MSDLFEAWREILHLSALTGLSAGALILLALIVYAEPTLRSLAIHIAIVIIICYVGMIYAFRIGVSDKQKEWDAADAKMRDAQIARDANINKAISAPYELQLAALLKQSQDQQRTIASYEQMLIGASRSAGCPLGTDALRLRGVRP